MTKHDLAQWLADYCTAWEARDPDAAARLFTEEALYFETPFAEPFRGRQGVHEYWARVTSDQRNVQADSTIVGVFGDTGIARWSARLELASNDTLVELDGVFLLEFENGLCATLREWWHAR